MLSKYVTPSYYYIYIRLDHTLSWLNDKVLEISYILHKKKIYYAIKEDPKNKSKSKLNNSDNLDCCITNPSAGKREKKKQN